MSNNTTEDTNIVDDYERYVRSSGGVVYLNKLIRESRTYKEFLELHKLYWLAKDYPDLTVDELRGIKKVDEAIQVYLDDVTEDDFYEMREDIINEYQHFEDEMKRMKASHKDYNKKKEKNRRNMLKKIFNGNFPTLNKENISEEDKVFYKVQGLHDEMFDIYIDEDNGTYQTLYYDFSTTNEKSILFVNYLRDLYKIKGINANWKAFLITFDRSLLGVSTDRKDLSTNIRLRQIEEGRRNPFYHFREVARIKRKTGEIEHYDITIKTWTWIWLYIQCFNTMTEGPRQIGKTFDITSAIGGEFAYAYRGFNSLFVHFNEPMAKKNKSDAITAADLLPPSFRLHSLVAKKDKKTGKEFWSEGKEDNTSNTKVSENKFLRNRIKVSAIGKTAEQAEKAGRGDSLTFPFIDEINFYAYPSKVLSSAQLAYGTTSRMADSAGLRHGVHIASTPGDLTGRSGQEMYKLIFEQMCMFELELFGYTYENLCEYLESNSEMNFFVIRYTYDQYGLNEEWLEFIKGIAGADFERDVLLKWKETNEGSIFSKESIDRIVKNYNLVHSKIKTNLFFEKNDKFVYYPDYQNEPFEEFITKFNNIGIGIDLAYGNATGDYVRFCFIDLVTGRKLITYGSNRRTIPETYDLFYRFTKHLVSLYKPLTATDMSSGLKTNTGSKLLLIANVEIDGPGQAFLPLAIGNEFTRKILFCRLKEYAAEKRDAVIKSYTKVVSDDTYVVYGSSMKEFRPYMFGTILYDMIDKTPQFFKDEDLISEIKTLVKKSEKVQAKSGYHDDTICAFLHAYCLIFSPKHVEALRKFFGFTVSSKDIELSPINSTIENFDELVGSHFDDSEIKFNRIFVKDKETGLKVIKPVISRVIDGRLTEYSDEEIQKEMETNPDLEYYLASIERDNIERLGIEYKNIIYRDKFKLHSLMTSDNGMLINTADKTILTPEVDRNKDVVTVFNRHGNNKPKIKSRYTKLY